MLTSAKRGETLTPNPNECNSTLTSGTKNIYPTPINVNDRGHRFRSGSPVTNYPCAAAPKEVPSHLERGCSWQAIFSNTQMIKPVFPKTPNN